MISKEDIDALAELARLKLKGGEAEAMGQDISNILGYVGQINTFEADAAKLDVPLQHNVMRADEPRATDDILAGREAAILAQLPRREGDYNVVRKIIQKDE